MGEQNEPSAVDRFLKRRAILRRGGVGLLVLIGSSVLLGNLWNVYRGGDDWTRFDRQYFVVQAVTAGDRIEVESANGKSRAIVQLLGVDAPDMPDDRGPKEPGEPGDPPAHWSLEARQALRELALGRRVMLVLPGLAPRAGDGALRAFVYRDANATEQSINEQLIAEGHAYADRRIVHPFQKQFDQTESEARRKRAGLWTSVRDDQQPVWRQQWLHDLARDDSDNGANPSTEAPH